MGVNALTTAAIKADKRMRRGITNEKNTLKNCCCCYYYCCCCCCSCCCCVVVAAAVVVVVIASSFASCGCLYLSCSLGGGGGWAFTKGGRLGKVGVGRTYHGMAFFDTVRYAMEWYDIA